MARRKNKFSIYLKAFVVWIGYTALSYPMFFWAFQTKNHLLAYLLPFVYGVFGALVFFYLFSHERFFKFAKEIEKRNIKKERKLLRLFRHHGKLIAVSLAGIIAGPVILALGTKLLLASYRHKYPFLVLVNIPSTIITIGMGRGLFATIALL